MQTNVAAEMVDSGTESTQHASSCPSSEPSFSSETGLLWRMLWHFESENNLGVELENDVQRHGMSSFTLVTNF